MDDCGERWASLRPAPSTESCSLFAEYLGGIEVGLGSLLAAWLTMLSGASASLVNLFFFKAGTPVTKENMPRPPSLVLA